MIRMVINLIDWTATTKVESALRAIAAEAISATPPGAKARMHVTRGI